jgi:hypothetical protein
MTMKQAGKRHARGLAAALLAVLGLALPAMAETKPTYDKRIEEAAIRMLVPKLGDMRGSLGVRGDDYLAAMVNEQVIARQTAPGRPETTQPPAKRLRIFEDTPLRVANDTPTHEARPEQRPLADNRAETPAATATGRRSKGSFLFF